MKQYKNTIKQNQIKTIKNKKVIKNDIIQGTMQ